MLNFVQLKNLVEQDFCLNFEHQNGGYALPRSTGPLGVGPACRRFIWRANVFPRLTCLCPVASTYRQFLGTPVGSCLNL